MTTRAGLPALRWHDLRHTWATWHAHRPSRPSLSCSVWENVDSGRNVISLKINDFDDHFLIARTVWRVVVLMVDEALGLAETSKTAIIGADEIVPGLEQFPGVVKLDDGLALIHDLERFLHLNEASTLDEAMERAE